MEKFDTELTRIQLTIRFLREQLQDAEEEYASVLIGRQMYQSAKEAGETSCATLYAQAFYKKYPSQK